MLVNTHWVTLLPACQLLSEGCHVFYEEGSIANVSVMSRASLVSIHSFGNSVNIPLSLDYCTSCEREISVHEKQTIEWEK